MSLIECNKCYLRTIQHQDNVININTITLNIDEYINGAVLKR